MIHNKTKLILRLAALLALLAGLGLTATPASVTQAQQNEENGEFAVSVFRDGMWRTIGSLSYGKHPAEKQLDLSDFSPSGEVKIRIDHSGNTAAHIDAVLLGGKAPRSVVGARENEPLALKKVASRDYDLIDAQGRRLTFTFDVEDKALTLSLTARIEPETISKVPFQFPLENRCQKLDTSSSFYTYVLNSQWGELEIDGNLENENLGTPFFKTFIRPGTGHPPGFTYGWVRNDDKSLYVAIDLVPDNTMDGDKDYAKVYVNTQAGLKEFKVSVPEQRWGVPGFVYTNRAVFQHKVYEFQIPFSEIGLAKTRTGETVELAFEVYGTLAPKVLSLSKSFTDDPVVPGGTVTLEFTITNTDPTSTATDIAFTDDLDAVLPGLVAVGLPVAVCGGTLAGTSALSFSGGSLPPLGSCTFSVTLQVPAGAAPGSYPNTTSQITGMLADEVEVEGDPASDDLEVAYGTIIIDKVTDPGGDPTSFDFSLTGGPSALNQSFSLTDSDPPHDSGAILPGSGYNAAETVPSGWDLATTCSDGSPATNITISSGETVACTFTNTKQFNLTVSKAGTCLGTVISNPSGINCGADCTEAYDIDTAVTLTAYPGVKSYFIEWSGNCAGTERSTAVIMDADKHCIATFGCPVGGIAVPVNRLGLVAPWMGMAALMVGAVSMVVVKRHRST